MQLIALGMRKTQDSELREIEVPTLEQCPIDNTLLRVRVDVGPGIARFKTKHCNTCGHVKELARG